MYSNIGGKLKALAKILGVLAIIVAIGGVFLGLTEDDDYLLLGVLCGASLFVASWPLYAFGQIVEDVHKIAEKDDCPDKQDGEKM